MEEINNNENEYINKIKKVAEYYINIYEGIGLNNKSNDYILLKYINDQSIINDTSNLILFI